MKRQSNGQLIFVSSVAGLRKFANCSVYGASKWAVQGIAGSLREECRGTGVKIATLCPGSVATPWWLERERGGKALPATEEQLGKMLTPEDVASAAMTVVDQVRPASAVERRRGNSARVDMRGGEKGGFINPTT
jgi:short-subunit dehydrogenase